MENHISNVSNRIILFVRAPEKGKVKTRLAREIGEKRTLELYMGFAESVLAAARSTAAGIHICFCPAERISMVKSWLGQDLSYFPQRGIDLGERMANALAHVFEAGAPKAVLVGSDIPGIQADHLVQAFDLLERNDMVIGPSLDGGYWLIGFTRQGFSPRLFCGVPWSTDKVCSTTLGLAEKAGLSWGRLAALRDVDTARDLKNLDGFPVPHQ